MNRILALEASKQLREAVVVETTDHGCRVLGRSVQNAGTLRDEVDVARLVREALAGARCRGQDLHGIAAAFGPGETPRATCEEAWLTLQGLAIAFGVPLVEVSVLDALARSAVDVVRQSTRTEGTGVTQTAFGARFAAANVAKRRDERVAVVRVVGTRAYVAKLDSSGNLDRAAAVLEAPRARLDAILRDCRLVVGLGLAGSPDARWLPLPAGVPWARHVGELAAGMSPGRTAPRTIARAQLSHVAAGDPS